MKKRLNIPARILVLIFRFYQVVISPHLMPRCRYSPTCSQYGVEAITKHGFFLGGWLSVKRVLSCNPFGGHGQDPVP